MAKSSQKDMEQLPALSPLELNRFIARLGVQPPKDAYPAKNTIGEIITPERQGWKKPEVGRAGQADQRSRTGANIRARKCDRATAVCRMNERAQAAALGDGPLAMFDDGLPLQFLRGPHCATGRAEVTAEVDTMGEISKQEDDWQAKATAAAIAGARKIALDLRSAA